MSKLWSASNGFQGCGPVCALVQAETRDQAIAAAENAFGAEIDPQPIYTDAEKAEYRKVKSITEVTLPYVGDVLP